MDLAQKSRKSTGFLLFIIVIQLSTCITILLDFRILREVFGFVYLTFIPGIVILRLLKIRNLNLVETVLFSVGLSIAFLLIAGLIVNATFPSFGVTEPLSLLPIATVLNVAVFLLSLVGYRTNKDQKYAVTLRLSPSLPLFLTLTFLSVYGVMKVNFFPYDDNIILIFAIILTSLVSTLSVFSEKFLHPTFHPAALFLISLALLLQSSLVSNHIYGQDIFAEYYVFNLTHLDSYWNPIFASYEGRVALTFNAMLSISVLPTIYSTILNLEGEWIFKIVYPLLFSFVPLGLYQLYKPRMDRRAAYLSVFFFISNCSFYTELLALTRQMIAELFYVLLFLTILKRNMEPAKRTVCFMIFSVALILSHYSMAYIFLTLILSTWLILYVSRISGIETSRTRNVTVCLAILFFVTLFTWNMYISSSSPFNDLVGDLRRIYDTFFREFSDPESRGREVVRALGLEAPPSLMHLFGRGVFYVTEAFILLGTVIYFYERKERFPHDEYDIFLSLNILLLTLCIIVPNFARTLNMTRFYHIQLFFLAPLCILGGKNFFRLISNSRVPYKICTLVMILTVLVPFLLFQTDLVYEITGDDSWSLPLSRYRMNCTRIYGTHGVVEDIEVSSAMWLSKWAPATSSIYADPTSTSHLLNAYGMIPRGRMYTLPNLPIEFTSGSYIFLRKCNVANSGVLIYETGTGWNLTDLPNLEDIARVYSNGACQTYRV